MTQFAFLESFDSIDATSPAKHPEFLKGYAAGLAEAALINTNDTARATDAIAATLQDAVFTFAESRAALLQDLRPLFEAICQQLFPASSQVALVGHIAHCLDQISADTLPATLRINIHPDHFDALAAVINTMEHAPLIERAAADDPALVAWVFHTASTKMVDLTSLCTTIENSLTAISQDQQKENAQ